MSSENIYTILASKPHNKHHLDRYFNFILACGQANSSLPVGTYTEKHHICPKAKDLFPEHKSFLKNPWNCALLTYRQHFIAHWMLWKAYGGSQTGAFLFMNRWTKINGKTYECLKNQLKADMKGKSVYIDKQNNHVMAYTNDPRIESGELLHINHGRKRSDEFKKMLSEKAKNCSAETRKKISEKAIGRKRDESFKQKISASNRNRKYSQETKNKIQKAIFEKDKTIYVFHNLNTNEILNVTRYEFFCRTGMNPKHLLKTGKHFEWRYFNTVATH